MTVEHRAVSESDTVASVISFSGEIGRPGLPGAYAYDELAAGGAALEVEATLAPPSLSCPEGESLLPTLVRVAAAAAAAALARTASIGVGTRSAQGGVGVPAAVLFIICILTQCEKM